MSKPSLIQTIPAVAACKITRRILRLAGRGGTALPGKAARLFAKDILARVSEGMEIIVVTGTNGKTTTSRMIEHALTSCGRDVLANKSGANLLSGVTAELTCNATMTGKPKSHYAVIECDEGALKQVAPLLQPKVILVTNLFRDQLDRYGEVTHTVNAIRKGIELVPQTTVCLNADDSLVASLAEGAANRVVWYGMDIPAGPQKEAAVSDAKYCIRCGAPYEYHYHTYAHLGGFYCPVCGYARQEAFVAVTAVESASEQGSRVRMRFGGESHEATIGLPAVYNIYNAVGAACALTAFGLSPDEILPSLADVHSSFGRMETFYVPKESGKGAGGTPQPEGPEMEAGGTPQPEGPEMEAGGSPQEKEAEDRVRVQMILVKNPAGCSQALSYVASMEEDFNLILCLNDRTADGHDISWIWDADYEQLSQSSRVRHILVSGDRAEDMQLRLKYADCAEEKIALEKDNEALLAAIRRSTLPVFILPNYTAMLALRKVLSDATGGGAFWEG